MSVQQTFFSEIRFPRCSHCWLLLFRQRIMMCVLWIILLQAQGAGFPFPVWAPLRLQRTGTGTAFQLKASPPRPSSRGGAGSSGYDVRNGWSRKQEEHTIVPYRVGSGYKPKYKHIASYMLHRKQIKHFKKNVKYKKNKVGWPPPQTKIKITWPPLRLKKKKDNPPLFWTSPNSGYHRTVP